MTSICLFCCTQLKGDRGNCEENGTSSEENLVQFLKVTQSHFGIDIPKIICSSEGGGHLYDKVCVKCEQSLQSICGLFREFESIRLKMEWEFGKLIRKMEVVGRTPSKVKWLRKNQSANDYQNISNFRNDFISKCNQSLEVSKPKLILQPIKIPIPNIIVPDVISDHFDDTTWAPSDNEDAHVDSVDDDVGNYQTDIKYSPSVEETSPFIHSTINTIPNTPIKKPFKCPQCPVAFTLRCNLLRHQKTKGHLKKAEEKPIKCPYCPVRLSNPHSLQVHQRKFHRSSYQSQRTKLPTSTSAIFTKPVRKPGEKYSNVLICSICQLTIVNKQHLLETHFDLNHSKKDVNPSSLHNCDYVNCSAYFRTLYQLTRHKKLVHGEDDQIPKTTCPICGVTCTEHSNLKFHMKTKHDDENLNLPLPCNVDPQCPKRFPNEAVLKWHLMYFNHKKWKHSLEIIKCSECHKECRGIVAYKRHQKKHRRPETPWICELCGAAFKSKSILRHHGFFHEGPDNWKFECEECGKKCATKHYLKQHMQVHSTVKKYTCECCGRGYKCRQKLRIHVNKFHAEEGFQDIPRKTKKPKFISRRIPASPSSLKPPPT